MTFKTTGKLKCRALSVLTLGLFLSPGLDARITSVQKMQKMQKTEEIRVAVARDVTLAELKKRMVSYTEDGKISFRGRRYAGRLDFFDNGDGTLTAVNILPLEEYLVGIIASEMPRDWPIEALKAQAAAARTYAVFQRDAKLAGASSAVYDVESTVLDQVYGGSNDDERLRRAVEETKGEVLAYHGRPIKSFFNSTCGGETESALNVWGEKNLFPSIKDPYCRRSPYFKWRYSITKGALLSKLRRGGFPAGGVVNISVERRDGNSRAGVVVIDTGKETFYIQGGDFRRMLGYDDLKSTWFDVAVSGDRIIFDGRGYGHGVGMCQWGAKGMADAGKSYREILKFYYPGAKIETLNPKR